MADTWKNIKTQLSTQFYFVNDNWLRDCVDYYKSERPDATQAEILAFVIPQWQLSDLREISNENGCLPKNLSQQKVITLTGTYILQIQKGYDISTSKYKQLEKIRNISNENSEINEAGKNPSWEPKAKRMMNLYLTDGVQNISAIEYQPIKFLKDLILPGLKIMIKGPVVCRRGVFLLHDKNCCEIGGEVESLLIKNATENVLARALNLVENPDPYKDNSLANKDKKDEIIFDDFMDLDLDELDKIEKSVDRNKNVNNQNLSMTSTEKKRESIMLNDLPVCFESIPEKKNEWDDTDDELIQMIDESNLSIIGQEETNDQLNNKNIINNKKETDDFNFDPDFPNELELEDFEIASALKEEQNYENKTNDNVIFQNNTSSNITSNVNEFSKEKNVPIVNVTKKITDTTVKPAPIFSHSNIKAPSPSIPIPSSSNKKPSITIPLTSPIKTPKPTRKTESKFDVKNNQKITAFIKKTDTPNKPSSIPVPKKYESVQDILELMPVDKVITRTIKGAIKSIKKLEKREQNWYLEGSISDDSGSLNFFFSSQVLEKIVGLTVTEFSVRKKLIKKDPNVEQELRMALRKAESTISKLNGLLQIELLPNESKVKIISVP